MKSVHSARRTTALTWGAIGEVGLLGVLFNWYIVRHSENAWIVALVVVAAFLTAVGMVVVVTASRLGTGVKWTAAVLIASVSGGIAVLAIVLLVAGSGTEGGIGLLLLLAVLGMDIIAAYIPRAAMTGTQAQRRRG